MIICMLLKLRILKAKSIELKKNISYVYRRDYKLSLYVRRKNIWNS